MSLDSFCCRHPTAAINPHLAAPKQVSSCLGSPATADPMKADVRVQRLLSVGGFEWACCSASDKKHCVAIDAALAGGNPAALPRNQSRASLIVNRFWFAPVPTNLSEEFVQGTQPAVPWTSARCAQLPGSCSRHDVIRHDPSPYRPLWLAFKPRQA